MPHTAYRDCQFFSEPLAKSHTLLVQLYNIQLYNIQHYNIQHYNIQLFTTYNTAYLYNSTIFVPNIDS